MGWKKKKKRKECAYRWPTSASSHTPIPLHPRAGAQGRPTAPLPRGIPRRGRAPQRAPPTERERGKAQEHARAGRPTAFLGPPPPFRSPSPTPRALLFSAVEPSAHRLAHAHLLMADAAGPSTALAVAVGAPDTVDRARHPSGIVPTLQNVVATVNLDCKLDLKNIALHARNAEYNPKVREKRGRGWGGGGGGGRRPERGAKSGSAAAAPAAGASDPGRATACSSRTPSLFSPLHSVSRPSSCASGTPRRPP